MNMKISPPPSTIEGGAEGVRGADCTEGGCQDVGGLIEKLKWQQSLRINHIKNLINATFR